jgi:hypothetical protein
MTVNAGSRIVGQIGSSPRIAESKQPHSEKDACQYCQNRNGSGTAGHDTRCCEM